MGKSVNSTKLKAIEMMKLEYERAIETQKQDAKNLLEDVIKMRTEAAIEAVRAAIDEIRKSLETAGIALVFHVERSYEGKYVAIYFRDVAAEGIRREINVLASRQIVLLNEWTAKAYKSLVAEDEIPEFDCDIGMSKIAERIKELAELEPEDMEEGEGSEEKKNEEKIENGSNES